MPPTDFRAFHALHLAPVERVQACLHLKIVLEPAGAIALAAAFSGAVDCRGNTIAVISSGSGVDTGVFISALEMLRAG